MSKLFTNAILVAASIISFALSFVPQVDPQFRIILLVSAPIILTIACFYIYLSKTDEAINKIAILKEKLKRAEELTKIKAEIKAIKAIIGRIK